MTRFFTKDKGLSLLALLIIFALWHLLSIAVRNEILIPSIGATLKRGFEIVASHGFGLAIAHTMGRTLFSFFLSLLLAIVLVGLSKASKLWSSIMRLVLSFLASVPVMAIILLALVWLSSTFVPVFVSFVMVFPILYETVMGSTKALDPLLIQMSKLYKVSKKRQIQDLYLPNIMAALSRVMSSTLSTTLKMVIAGEVLSQPGFAIGSQLLMEKTYLNTAGIFAWIVIILIISKLLRLTVRFLRYAADVKFSPDVKFSLKNRRRTLG